MKQEVEDPKSFEQRRATLSRSESLFILNPALGKVGWSQCLSLVSVFQQGTWVSPTLARSLLSVISLSAFPTAGLRLGPGTGDG